MAKKTSEPSKTFHISVVGLSGTEKDKGQLGVGKSCLCNRFLHPLADEYYTDHISVLSQSDFSGPVVNNDHFLYWGEVTKTTDDGIDLHFSVVEQTEFIDDASFQPFKGGKLEPYAKRCSSIKVISAEKLMYICKNQLGIEKEYEQKVLPDGKINVDGFLCVFDVSQVQNRSLEKQLESVTNILNNLVRTKKPIVLATTKSDEGCDPYLKEAERLVNRKEYRGMIPLVETSAHENINIELAFIVLAQMIDKTKGRTKIAPFSEATKARREILDVATDAYHSLIRSQITDFRAVWATTERRLANNQDFVHFVELFGRNAAQREFRRHVKRLKEEYVAQKKHKYLLSLPEVFHHMLPDLTAIGKGDWLEVRSQLKEHPDFNEHFVECPDDTPWEDSDISESGDRRIPYDLLDSPEAETLFRNHLNALRAKQKTVEMKKQFKQLLEDAGYVTPGKLLSDVKVLFMGRECYEALSEEECQEIYDIHQKEITEKAKQNFLELLQEHADRFYQLTSAVPSGAITQEDIKEIKDVLQEDFRYKALDRLEQDRQLILFQHLGFVHCPIREHCPSYPNCMDNLIEQMMTSRMKKSVTMYETNSSSALNTDSNQLNLVLLGAGGIAETLVDELRLQCEDDEYVLDNYLYTLEYRVISGDVSLPQNAFLTSDFLPHGCQPKEMRGCFCVYCDSEGFEYIRDSLEKTLMSNLEQDRLQFQDLPIVILFAVTSNLGEKDVTYLRDEGQSLSESFQCPFIEISMKSDIENDNDAVNVQRQQLSEALRLLIGCIQHKASTLTIYQPQRGSDPATPDIRVIMCLLCGDPYPVEHVLSPLITSPTTFVSSERSIILETYLGEFKRRVEVIVSSYHGANAFRDELVHGVILVYSTKRKASLATLKAFSMNIPNLPIQILAVTESGGANAFFSSNLSQLLIKDGNAIADQLQAHFMTATSTSQQKTAFYNPFFKEVWDKKAEIEHAFNMDEPLPSNQVIDDSTLPLRGPESTLDKRSLHSSSVVPTQDSYHTLIKLQDGKNNRDGHYERLSSSALQGDDMEEPLSPTYGDDRDQPRTPSDDSEPYYLYNQENGNSLVKPSQLRKRSNRHDGYYDDSCFQTKNYYLDEGFRSYTTGRRKFPPPTKPKPGKPQPGKLNLNKYGNVTNAIAKLSLSAKDHGTSTTPRLKPGRVYAPLATPESVELGPDYALVKDAITTYESNDEEYATVHDLHGGRSNRVRSAGRDTTKAKFRIEQGGVDDDSGFEVSSPKDSSSPIMLRGTVSRLRDQQPQQQQDKTGRRKEKQKLKDDEKLEKRRLKEEEKQKRLAEKEREKQEKKKPKKVGTGPGSGTSGPGNNRLEEFIQSEENPVPLFLEKCIHFIEEEGMDSEGIYRVPGNRAHVDLLFQRFEEDFNVSIKSLDIPVNAVATALKDFFSKRLPHLMSQEAMNDLIEISAYQDRSRRLLALKAFLKKLPPINFDILRYVFRHFVGVAENCKLNSMDSKNLAICWWPTLLPIEFTDMGVFERMRPHLEDAVQNMIDQYPFLFCDKEEVVMV
ncbi:hypothetical protein CHUAL_004810 [Chamberlinius hualienensis]